jgi:hypothetical protein
MEDIKMEDSKERLKRLLCEADRNEDSFLGLVREIFAEIAVPQFIFLIKNKQKAMRNQAILEKNDYSTKLSWRDAGFGPFNGKSLYALSVRI